MATTTTDEMLTAQEAADYIGVSINGIYQWRWLGVGPVSHKRNGRIVFRRADIDRWLDNERLRTLRGEGV
jgi:predicted site-specific integrase-resolvase